MYFSLHHKIASIIGKFLNLIILSPNPDSIGNASEEIFFAMLKAKKEGKKLVILFPRKFVSYFVKNINFYDKNFFNLNNKYFYFKHNSFWQNFWSSVWSIYFIFARVIFTILTKILNIKKMVIIETKFRTRHYFTPNINIKEFRIDLSVAQKWEEQLKKKYILILIMKQN